MTEKPKKTPKEELKCSKKYVYDTGIIFECKENSRVQILGEDVVGLLNELTEENERLKQENKELHRLNHEEVESWSDEKKQMIAEFSNLMFGDKINDRKQKNNWKNKY